MIHEQNKLNAERRVTEAQIIRWCVLWLQIDPNTYRMRGHEGYAAGVAIRKENNDNKNKALLYLEWLATQMENVRSSDDQPKET